MIKHWKGGFSERKGKTLKLNWNPKGYAIVKLYREGRKKTITVHRLVAIAFVSNPENKTMINHKDANKTNNTPENLEWCCNAENIQHAYDHGLIPRNKGEECYNSKLTEKDVQYIKENYKKGCKELGARGLARKFNVTHSLVLNIVKGKGWKHV